MPHVSISCFHELCWERKVGNCKLKELACFTLLAINELALQCTLTNEWLFVYVQDISFYCVCFCALWRNIKT
jgi:hypothetical protein